MIFFFFFFFLIINPGVLKKKKKNLWLDVKSWLSSNLVNYNTHLIIGMVDRWRGSLGKLKIFLSVRAPLLVQGKQKKCMLSSLSTNVNASFLFFILKISLKHLKKNNINHCKIWIKIF